MRQRLGDKRDSNGVKTIDRFQKFSDHPYSRKYGAAAVITNSSFIPTSLSLSDAKNHPFKKNLEMLIVRGETLIPLINALYERGANET